jgi:hypothetical protein
MSRNRSRAVSAISILFLAAGQAILAPDRADAQGVQPTPTLNTKINQLRLNIEFFTRNMVRSHLRLWENWITAPTSPVWS